MWHIKLINYSWESLAVSGIHYGNYGGHLTLMYIHAWSPEILMMKLYIEACRIEADD